MPKGHHPCSAVPVHSGTAQSLIQSMEYRFISAFVNLTFLKNFCKVLKIERIYVNSVFNKIVSVFLHFMSLSVVRIQITDNAHTIMDVEILVFKNSEESERFCSSSTSLVAFQINTMNSSHDFIIGELTESFQIVSLHKFCKLRYL